jgi:hypothetical protein
MGREIIMVGICTLAVIGLAWLMDHPQKELGSLIALGAFGVMVLVAYLKSRDQRSRRPGRLIVTNKRRGYQAESTSSDQEQGKENE